MDFIKNLGDKEAQAFIENNILEFIYIIENLLFR